MNLQPQKVDIEFVSTTSLHGVQHLLQRTLAYKITWCILIISAMSICLWQITDRVQQYLTYPTTVDFEENHKEEMNFPTVTFCSGYRYEDNRSLSKGDKYIFEYNSLLYKQLEELELIDKDTVINLYEATWIEFNEIMKSFYPDGYNFTNILLKNAYQLNDESLLICQFDSSKCDSKDFFFFLNLNLQICWAFNSHLNNNKSNTLTDSGPDTGLFIAIDMQRDHHSVSFQLSMAKFFAFFTPYGEIPLNSDLGIPIGPGHAIYMKLKYNQFKYMPAPYGNCEKNKTLPHFDIYTIDNCISECEINFLRSACHCQPYTYEGFYNNYDNRFCDFKDYFLCHLGYRFQYNQTNAVVDETLKKEVDCSQCLSSCNVEKYDTTLYYTSPMDSETVKHVMKQHNVSKEYVRNNYIILNIYFEKFVYVSTTEKASMTVSSLLSDIGGTLGLFLGMSVLTIAEVVDYIARKISTCLKSTRGYNKPGIKVKNIEDKTDVELEGNNST